MFSIISRRIGGLRATSATANRGMQTTYGAYINGKYVKPENTTYFKVGNPATMDHLCEVVSSDEATIDLAVNTAERVYQSGVWSKSDVRYRAQVMNAIAAALRADLNRLAEMEVAQTGRSVREMKAQLARLPEWFEYFGSLIRVHEGSVPPFLGSYVNYVKRVPLGVVAQLTAWNHPMLIAIKKIAPAIACGNSIVLKPSEYAPASVLEIAEIFSKCGLPDGVFNVVPGLGPLAGQVLCKHPLIRKVDLTGGTSTGRAVGAAAGANLAGVISELGGKAPMIVFEDADIEQAVNGAAFATFVATGQTCIMGARVLVHKSVYNKFVNALTEKASRIRMGDPMDVSTQMGPVISHASRNRIDDMIKTAVGQGAVVKTGGCIPDLPEPWSAGSYYAPTVLEVDKTMSIWKEEVFGPVVVAIPFEDEAEAIELANDSDYGLAAAVWTKDIMRGHRVADNLNVGIIWLNDHHRNDPSSPWGGMKDSGVGRENGLAALYEYTQTRSVVVRTDDTPFDWFEDPNSRYS